MDPESNCQDLWIGNYVARDALSGCIGGRRSSDQWSDAERLPVHRVAVAGRAEGGPVGGG